MIKKYWQCIIAWIGVMCGMAALIFIHFLPHIVSATLGFISMSILVAAVIYLLNKL